MKGKALSACMALAYEKSSEANCAHNYQGTAVCAHDDGCAVYGTSEPCAHAMVRAAEPVEPHEWRWKGDYEYKYLWPTSRVATATHIQVQYASLSPRARTGMTRRVV